MTQIPIISLWQPWASAVVTPHPFMRENVPVKGYETRSWPTKVTGRILVHAAKKWSKDLEAISSNWPFKDYKKYIGRPDLGCIVGSVEIVRCMTTEYWMMTHKHFESESVHEEYKMGDFSENRFAWELANPVKFDEAVPCKGQQGFWKVPLSVVPAEHRYLFK